MGHHDESSAAVINIKTHNRNLEPLPPKLEEIKF